MSNQPPSPIPLKDCPFCGSKAGWNWAEVYCTNPGCFCRDGSGVDYDTFEECAAAWNRRVIVYPETNEKQFELF